MRKPRAELAIDHCAADRKEASHGPEQENEHGITKIPGHQARGREDSSTDDVADQKAARRKPADGVNAFARAKHVRGLSFVGRLSYHICRWLRSRRKNAPPQ